MMFTGALLDALTRANVDHPQRLAITPPTWVTLKQFVKTAYVVFHTAADARAAVDAIKEARFVVPGPIDMEKGEPMALDAFSVETALYRPRPAHNLKAWYSSSRRVEKDLERAVELAEVLDLRYAVPAERTLSSLLALPEVMDACALPCDALDVSICYLRRVHFVALYAGKRYKDEADLLFELAPSHVRTAPYFVDVEADATEGAAVQSAKIKTDSTGNADAVLSGASDAADADAGVGEEEGSDNGDEEGDGETSARKRCRQTDDDNEEDVEGEDQQDNADGSKQASVSEAKPKIYRGLPHRMPLSDNRITIEIRQLKPGSKESKQYHQNKEDAETLTEAEEQVFTALVEKVCPKEGDEGKARCCFTACAKLFKNYDFLKKHLRARHELFGWHECLECSEAYMKTRFHAQPLLMQPLPPVEVEGPHGIELKQFREVQAKARQQQQQQQQQQFQQQRGNYRGQGRGGRGGFDGNRGGGGGGGRGGMDRRDNFAPAASAETARASVGSGRALSSYMDIDAPKAAASLAVDYGVAVLPPAKKRKVIVKAD